MQLNAVRQLFPESCEIWVLPVTCNVTLGNLIPYLGLFPHL